jgi:hypothetical protein
LSGAEPAQPARPARRDRAGWPRRIRAAWPGHMYRRAAVVAAASVAAAALVAAVTIVPSRPSGAAPARARLTACPSVPGLAECNIWSGQVAVRVPAWEVGATFQVPSVSCPQAGGGEEFWVGVAGSVAGLPLTQASIARAGWAVECDGSSSPAQPTYSAFTATAIGNGREDPLQQPVQAGDTINVYVFQFSLYGSTPGWDAWVQDVSQNWEQYVSISSSPASASYTAVAADSINGGVTSGATPVTNAQVNFNPIGQDNPELWVQDPSIYQTCGNPPPAALVPTALDGTGQNFQFAEEPAGPDSLPPCVG